MDRVAVSRRRLTRGLTRGVGLLVAAVALVAVIPTGAQAASSSEFVAAINAARTSRGGHALSVKADLNAAAQAQAERMADKSTLYHNPDLGGSVSHWTMLAENVGYGPNVSTIHTAFMNSSGHRTNILNPKYTEVGVGVVVRDHVMWVAEVFRRPTGVAASSSSGSGSSTSKAANKKSSAGSKQTASPASHRAASKGTKAPAKKATAPRVTPTAKPLVVPHAALLTERWKGGAPTAQPVALSAAPAVAKGSLPTDVPPAAAVTLGVLAFVVVGGAARLRILG